jgi:hypothetical protein
MNTQDKISQFAELLHTEQVATLTRRYPNIPDPDHYCRVTVTPAKKYTRVDVGSSGKYMVENDTEIIYGIKAYGVIHRGHSYGTLDTINDWKWGDYIAHRKPA